MDPAPLGFLSLYALCAPAHWAGLVLPNGNQVAQSAQPAQTFLSDGFCANSSSGREGEVVLACHLILGC